MIRSLGLAVVLAAGAMVVPGPARAADDGYQNVVSSVLTAVGVLGTDKSPDINYRERPPLVLPPKTALVKPAGGTKLPAAWPQDPDVLKQRRADEAARAPAADEFAHSRESLLSKDELMQGRAGPRGEPTEPTAVTCGSYGHGDANCLRVTPDQLKAEGEAMAREIPSSKDAAQVGVEPDRLYLTQPPKGYMKATRVVKATTEAPEIKIDAANPKSSLLYQKPQEE